MASLWKLGGLSPKKLATRVWSEIQEDEVFGRAAQLSYYFLLALFPLLIFLTSVIGLVIGSETDLSQSLFNYLARVVPPAAFQLIDSTMREVSAASSGSKVSLGILAALWAASNGMGAITEALNVAYDVKESRSWWKQRLVAVSLTMVLSLLIISALVMVLAGDRIADSTSVNYALGSFFLGGMEDRAVADSARRYVVRLCSHLLFRPRRARTEMDLDYAWSGSWRGPLVASFVWLSHLPALLRFLQQYLWFSGGRNHTDALALPNRRSGTDWW